MNTGSGDIHEQNKNPDDILCAVLDKDKNGGKVKKFENLLNDVENGCMEHDDVKISVVHKEKQARCKRWKDM